MRSTRAGELYQSKWHERMRGVGPYAEMLARRFQLAERRAQFPGMPRLDTGQFIAQPDEPRQFGLFS